MATLDTYAAPINALPVTLIDTALVLKCIEPHWATKTETMTRVRQRVEAVMDWATVREYRSGDNPARWKGHLDQLLAHSGSLPSLHADRHQAGPYPIPRRNADQH